MARAFEAFEAFGGFEASQTATLNAQKKPLLRPRGALEPLLWLCGVFCVRAWRCWACWGTSTFGAFGGFGGFEAWQTDVERL